MNRCPVLALALADAVGGFDDPKSAAAALAFNVWLTPPALRLRAAAQMACPAYEQSQSMGDAAIVYGACGVPVLPLAPGTKVPIPRRERDPTGTYPRGIPGTGGVYKATTDLNVIEAWWKKTPNALIGMPMGARTGVWALDIDTSEDHADGASAWDELIKQHGAIFTREHRSATGGAHLIFNWNAALPLGCSAGELPDGIEVKGRGGYIVVPPSRRKGRAYTIFNEVDPTDAPPWLLDLIKPSIAPPAAPSAPMPYSSPAPLLGSEELDEIADAMRFVPNEGLAWGRKLCWQKWTSIGMALWAATGGSEAGFALFDAFSRKAGKLYSESNTLARWREITGSPPNRTGADKLFKIARANGWTPSLRRAAPTHAPEVYADADAARSQIREIAAGFLSSVAHYHSTNWNDDNWLDGVNRLLSLKTWAVNVTTGGGKTSICIEEIAKWIHAGAKAAGPIIYAVPRHKLGHDIEKQFAEYDIDARIFRGRDAIDVDEPKFKMCRNPGAVALAMKVHADISSTCCANKKERCSFFDVCGYQRQMPDKDNQPDVWIVASDMLFHKQKALGSPAAVIIDEAIWHKGIRGEQEDTEVPIASLLNPQFSLAFNHDMEDLNALRRALGAALQAQSANGGVERQHLEAVFDISDCELALKLEWKFFRLAVESLALHPGMSAEETRRLECDAERLDAIQHTRRIIQIWEAVRELLDEPDIEVSGRLVLKQENGQRVVRWRGIAPVSEQFQVPMLLLDATLPDAAILQAYHPEVQIVANLTVATPQAVHIRQVLKAPTSSKKLDAEKHLAATRRYILQRFIETNRQRTLVICQEKVERWLRESGLPAAVHIEHYNDVTGIDAYKDVRLLMLIGRTAPGPQAVETQAAALFGTQPIVAAPRSNGFAWYDAVQHGIRLPDGTGIATTGDLHPDANAEAIRKQVHEAGLLQALGRGRAINRTTDAPLDIDLLVDTCLPITVSEVRQWSAPSLLIATAGEGVMLTSPVDMVKIWPKVWPNIKAAERTLEQPVPILPGFAPVEYQLAGPKMKQRIGYFDNKLIPDPMNWLQERLGALAFPGDGGAPL